VTEPRPLRCPYCGGTFETVLEYTARYSEHRDLTGFECENYECDAAWKPNGDVDRLPRGTRP
jgi:hypothetical protein